MTGTGKYLVEIVGDGEVYVYKSQTILNASLSAGFPHLHACGGNAKCSTCRVLVLDGAESLTPPNKNENFLKEKMRFPPNVRLACQTYVLDSQVRLRRIIQDETDISLYVDEAAGANTQYLGEEKEMALFFLDIRDFTHFVGTHLAFDVIHIIRKLFSMFQKFIEKNGGTILETAGDGLYAVFGNGMGRDDAQAAVQSAQEILAELETLNDTYFLLHFGDKINIGIGIHIGKVVSGSVKIGTLDHLVVMGYAVNIASRLQNATKDVNNNFVVSAEVYDLLADPPLLNPRLILVKGISTYIKVYLLGKPYRKADIS